MAGFGPFFSGCLILALLLGLILMVTMRATRWPMVLITAAVICSLLLSRHLWWPRYGPQLWLLPILPVAIAFEQRVSGYKLVLARAIFTPPHCRYGDRLLGAIAMEINASIYLAPATEADERLGSVIRSRDESLYRLLAGTFARGKCAVRQMLE